MVVAEKTQVVQTLFRETQLNIENQSVDTVLKTEKGEFASVVYEAIAVCLANQDIKNKDNFFSLWSSFCDQHASLHGSQIYVGLGWAMCESAVSEYTFLEELPSVWRWRVLDGYGYYSGLFKRRETIRSQQIPPFISNDDTHAFNQGIGRSLWYLSQGDIERLTRSLNLFEDNRQVDMWRGIGLAATYVGGIDASLLKDIQLAAEEYLPQFKCGALMAIAARKKSAISSSDTTFISESLSLENISHIDRMFSTCGSYYSLLQEIEASL